MSPLTSGGRQGPPEGDRPASVLFLCPQLSPSLTPRCEPVRTAEFPQPQSAHRGSPKGQALATSQGTSSHPFERNGSAKWDIEGGTMTFQPIPAGHPSLPCTLPAESGPPIAVVTILALGRKAAERSSSSLFCLQPFPQSPHILA